jgi:response regulator RpfG family c-di-GMP phosphodiesterase
MDLQMPEMDGYEATRRIRNFDDPHFKTLPIIALTASAMAEIRDRILESGMDDFLSKPFQPEALQAKISKYVFQHENIIENEDTPSNLDIYSEGDPEFKRELAELLIKNVDALKDSITEYLNTNDVEPYKKVYHRCKTTVSMLGDREFNNVTEEIYQIFAVPELDQKVNMKWKIDRFLELAERVTLGLEEEMSSI